MSKVSTPKIMIKEEFIIEDNIIPLKKVKRDEEREVNSPTLPKIGRPSSSTGLPVSSDTKPKSLADVNKTKKPCNCTRSQCLKLYVFTLILVVVHIDYYILLF